VATGFATQEQEILVNVYQGLLMYNYTSATELAPILSTSWTVYPNDTTYTFNLRNDSWFANGNAFNASVVWYNYYRDIIMNQFAATFFTNTLYNGTTALNTGYNIPAGVQNAMTANGYTFTSNVTAQPQQVATDLASLLSNFNPSNSTIQSIMAYPGQAVQVISNYEVQFNLIQPYSDFLLILASPGALLTDPGYVNQNGGVQPNTANTYMNTHTMSTGPYEVESYVQSEYVTFVANPNYWAAKLPASQSNIMLTPPHIPVVITQYFNGAISQVLQGFENNQAALLQGPPTPALSIAPSYLAGLASHPGINITAYPSAPKFAYLMAALDTQKYPTNITAVRQAIVHAVNITQLIQSVAEGYAQPYVGPIPPGDAYYNPGNLSVYSYDPELSIQLLSGAGFAVNLPNGTTVNSGGVTPPSLLFSYTSGDAAQLKLAQEMQIDLENVGLTVTLAPLTATADETVLTQPGNATTYPNLMLWYWYPGWMDTVAQDLVVTVNGYYGGFAGNVAWLNNATINNLTFNLPYVTNQTQYNATVTQVYNMVYQQAPDLWLYALVDYTMAHDYLGGVIYSPFLTGMYFPLMYYKSSS
jgi:peptide/nickel transport system substrate-binding protein